MLNVDISWMVHFADYLCIKHIVEIKHSFIKTVSRKNFIILMAAILDKSSKVHFVCKLFLATSEN